MLYLFTTSTTASPRVATISFPTLVPALLTVEVCCISPQPAKPKHAAQINTITAFRIRISPFLTSITMPVCSLCNCTLATTQIATFHAQNAHTAPSQRVAANSSHTALNPISHLLYTLCATTAPHPYIVFRCKHLQAPQPLHRFPM